MENLQIIGLAAAFTAVVWALIKMFKLRGAITLFIWLVAFQKSNNAYWACEISLMALLVLTLIKIIAAKHQTR